ncbi:glycosyl transferase [Legionella qingyii]|uniref:Glycosyl transferase n=1 Tax=Legionella qingyii TaxID=2184757 RepID=A0A317U368_9GAMM|nr:glycosyltransferase [Legionella qingyii]PWY55688.1 glycosyl transferase [Legionella qingyii]RUR21644.1 glycosyltransferase [Legionella qingyii]RUR25088.1 glycosyltransferase [Legionella qingyii]
MKILHIIQRLKYGGLEHLVFSMLCHDVKNVYILALEDPSEESFRQWPKLKEYQNNLFFADKTKGFSLKTVNFIKDICRTLSISVIHTHHLGPLIYGCLATSQRASIKHIHTEHDIWHLQHYKDWLIQYFLFNWKKQIHLVAVSKDIYTQLKSYFPKMDISTIPNAVDTRFFIPGNQTNARKYFKLPESSTIIGSAGRLETVKGHIYLIEAIRLMPLNYFLVIAGIGSLYQTLLTHIQTLDLSDRICLLGMVEPMNLFYQACDIFCLPSLNEGMPLSLLEAQACSVPVVCSNVGGCAEEVDPESGLLIPSQNPKAIAEACMKINQKTEKPREYILKNFSFDTLINHYYQLYVKV